jgi:hypothetical protein
MSEIESPKPKLCPYRTYVEFEVPDDLGTDKTAHRFAPCLQEKCAMNRSVMAPIGGEMKQMNYCGLAGKP